MKPKIKQIQIEMREWDKGDWHYLVSIGRWSHLNKQCKPIHASYSGYYEVTPASLARVRRAQESMIGKG